jgi:hypothetical protein
MRRARFPVAALILLLLPSAGTAHAQSHESPARAVSALHREFAKKSGVVFSRRTVEWDVAMTVAHGRHRFAPRVGVYASDVKETYSTGGEPTRFRMINIGRDSYVQDERTDLPKGKKWRHWRNAEGFLWSRDLVDALNPEFLRLISPGAKRVSTGDRYDGVRTTRFDGSVKVALLGTRKAGIFYGPKKATYAGGRIEWKLWLGPDDLPRRFQARILFGPIGPDREMRITRMNVLYKRWGSPVRITAPPRRMVAKAP